MIKSTDEERAILTEWSRSSINHETDVESEVKLKSAKVVLSHRGLRLAFVAGTTHAYKAAGEDRVTLPRFETRGLHVADESECRWNDRSTLIH